VIDSSYHPSSLFSVGRDVSGVVRLSVKTGALNLQRDSRLATGSSKNVARGREVEYIYQGLRYWDLNSSTPCMSDSQNPVKEVMI